MALPCLPPGTGAWGAPAPYWMPGSSLEPLQQEGAWLGPAICSFLSFPRHKLADQRTRKSLGRGEFRLLHYAGEVTYSVTGEDSGAGSPQWAGRRALPHLVSAPPSQAFWIKTMTFSSGT